MGSTSGEASMKGEVTMKEGGGGGEAVVVVGGSDDQLSVYRGVKKAKKKERLGCTAKERISKMPPCAAGKRSSIYRGVTRHRWTGRYEAHLWDKSTWNQNQNKKGKQVYLGAYDDEEAAARAYDLAALKYWGPGTLINFPVTDYTRDLEEMQNVSREDYLASLRRKSSGFSRGVAKYRGLSSRWDASGGRTPGPNYFNSIHYGTGEDAGAESEYASGFCIDRKIDLTPYIKWWGSSRIRVADSLSRSTEETKSGHSDDIESELKPLERAICATQPYQMPCFSIAQEEGKRDMKLSAMSILSQSAAFKSLQEKASKTQDNLCENDESENKVAVNKMEYGKAIEKLNEGALHLQRNMYPIGSILAAPLMTSYNSIDHLKEPIIWTTLGPVIPAGLHSAEVTKTETSSNYTFFQQKE